MPVITRQQSREIDRRAVEEFAMPSILLMENAARSAAEVILDVIEELREEHHFKHEAPGVAIVCGGGNNGGDGYAIARHLFNHGIEVAVFAAVHPEKLTGDAATMAQIVRRMDLGPEFMLDAAAVAARTAELGEADIIVDALLGTGFSGEVRGHLVDVIGLINRLREEGATTVAIDIPSGLDCDTGKPSNATIEADVTVTFVAEKVGFAKPGAERYTGRVIEADIGAPAQLL